MSYQCAYCTHYSSLQSENVVVETAYYRAEDNDYALQMHVLICPNSKCGKETVFVHKYLAQYEHRWHHIGEALNRWDLLPACKARPLPEYIPRQLRDDYYESYNVVKSSPKASATLCRRVLQGIIRDFWRIKKDRLIDEINELKGNVDPDVWGAIDAVLKIGNIGAQMEQDINVIIDVEPNEAQLLLELNELLFQEWYIARADRKKRLEGLTAHTQKKPQSLPGLFESHPGLMSANGDKPQFIVQTT